MCDETQDLVYGVSENETVSVSCSVNSFPPADTFTWSFNNSLTSSLLPPASYLSSPGHSLISYTPHSHMDFGTLLCWGTNMVGNQRTNQPCVFHIIPTGQHITNIPYGQSSAKLPVTQLGHLGTWSLGHLVIRSLSHMVTSFNIVTD